MKILDMQGKPCPMPVLEAKRALSEPGVDALTVLVDNAAAAGNLARMAAASGYACRERQGPAGRIEVELSKTAATTNAAVEPANQPASVDPELVVLIARGTLGDGDEALGRILIKGYIYALSQLERVPSHLIFVNGGVHLAVEGAATLDDLKSLEARGTAVLACGTCLNYFALTEKLAVGAVTDMYRIVNVLTTHARVISL